MKSEVACFLILWNLSRKRLLCENFCYLWLKKTNLYLGTDTLLPTWSRLPGIRRTKKRIYRRLIFKFKCFTAQLKNVNFWLIPNAWWNSHISFKLNIIKFPQNTLFIKFNNKKDPIMKKITRKIMTYLIFFQRIFYNIVNELMHIKMENT